MVLFKAIFVKRASITNLATTTTTTTTTAPEEKEDPVKGKKQAKLSNFFAVGKPKKDETLAPPASTAVSSTSAEDNNKKVAELKAVSYDFENVKKQFDGEGRTITLEFDKFYLVACYVPNSGKTQPHTLRKAE